MLDPFCVNLGDRFADPDREQEFKDDMMTFHGVLGKFDAGSGQVNRRIWLGGRITVANESRNRAIDRHAADPEPLGKIHSPALAVGCRDFGDRLDVVLRQFRGVVGSRLTVTFDRLGLIHALRRWLGRDGRRQTGRPKFVTVGLAKDLASARLLKVSTC